MALLALLAPLLLALVVGAAPASAGPSWGWPLAGPPPVTRPFAPGPTPYSPGHRGADLSARPGAAVLSAGGGVVAYAGRLAGRGVVVVVHGTLRTTYEPVDASVAVGQPVLRGQPIGSLAAGHRGCPVEACLHWGLRRGLDHLDPLRLVGAGPVRLLPREGGGSSAWPLGALEPRAQVPAGGAGPPSLPLGITPESRAQVPAAGAAGASAPAAGPVPPGALAPPAPSVSRGSLAPPAGSGPAAGPQDAARQPDQARAPSPRLGPPAQPPPDGSAPPAGVVLAVAAAGLLGRALLRPP